ncbi:ACT domain-containing protein [Methanosarcina horonobensis]|uniref:ACT domain-containing protein n=1 Tax=Methanosarcina horonobensis TaxID=418008 RepID=UPI0009E24F0F|nr:ACT domain-containing protein [Methanosarcina horonobensis]
MIIVGVRYSAILNDAENSTFGLWEKINYGRKSGDYVFCTVDGNYSDYEHLNPLTCFMKEEGLTLSSS